MINAGGRPACSASGARAFLRQIVRHPDEPLDGRLVEVGEVEDLDHINAPVARLAAVDELL